MDDNEEMKRHHRVTKLDVRDMNEDGLGIYEDTADGDDLTDTDSNSNNDNDDVIEKVRETNEMDEENYPNDGTIVNPGKLTIGHFSAVRTADDDDDVSDDDVDVGADLVDQDDQDEGQSQVADLHLKTNTPADPILEWRSESRVRSGLDPETKEGVYHEAMNLMSTRCVSRQDHGEAIRRQSRQGTTTPLVTLKDYPPGTYAPKLILVKQKKPLPMPPLKAWRGYFGNVYFEPIGFKKVKYTAKKKQESLVENYSDKLRAILATASKQNRSINDKSCNSSRPNTRLSAYDRQFAVLDKEYVLRSYNNANMHDDLEWMKGRESKGSLREEPPHLARRKDPRLMYNKERICKGSVAHKQFVQRQTFPFLGVRGEQFAPDCNQYMPHPSFSLCNPELPIHNSYSSYLNYDHLPPIETMAINKPLHTSM